MVIFRYLLAIVSICAAVFATGMYMGFKGSFKSEHKIEGEISFQQGPQPTARPSPGTQNEQKKEPELKREVSPELPPPAPNATDRWISEYTNRAYFIHQIGDQIQIFENDDSRQRIQTGSGSRNGDEITAQYYSQLGGTNGVLKLKLSRDGKSLVGRFTPLDNRSKEGSIRLLRTSS